MKSFKQTTSFRTLRFSLSKCVMMIGILLLVSSAQFSWAVKKEVRLYRYINDDGVKEISQSLPSKYAQKGYEIINLSGMVIKVVSPAPTAEEIKKQQFEANALERYTALRKRYSTVKDIEGAKERKIESINTSIAILQSNVDSLSASIEEQVDIAARIERNGRAVPTSLLKKLDDTKSELAISKNLLKSRQEEIGEVSKKFEQDIKSYTLGKNIADIRAADAIK